MLCAVCFAVSSKSSRSAGAKRPLDGNSPHDQVKLLIEHLKEIYNSPLVKYAKDTSDMDLKVAFFFALGSCVSLVKRKDGPKWLKKKPLLQTWCDRVITTFFPRYDIPDDTEDKLREKTEKLIERAGGSVVDVWLKSRYNSLELNTKVSTNPTIAFCSSTSTINVCNLLRSSSSTTQ